MAQFSEYVDKQKKEIKKRLKILENLFKNKKMKVFSSLNGDDPYIFVAVNEDSNLSFEGIRIYEIGKNMAYRIQKNKDTHPYGKSYTLDLESLFNDFMSEGMKPQEAGKKVIEEVVNKVSIFFKESEKAETKLQEKEGEGKLTFIARAGGGDYSAIVMTPTSRY